jgi:hypothetical protein
VHASIILEVVDQRVHFFNLGISLLGINFGVTIA